LQLNTDTLVLHLADPEHLPLSQIPSGRLMGKRKGIVDISGKYKRMKLGR